MTSFNLRAVDVETMSAWHSDAVSMAELGCAHSRVGLLGSAHVVTTTGVGPVSMARFNLELAVDSPGILGTGGGAQLIGQLRRRAHGSNSKPGGGAS